MHSLSAGLHYTCSTAAYRPNGMTVGIKGGKKIENYLLKIWNQLQIKVASASVKLTKQWQLDIFILKGRFM